TERRAWEYVAGVVVTASIMADLEGGFCIAEGLVGSRRG
ncbi:MAG: hypothetical protein K0S70_2311, partial [Microbacterium sp.]|nr:hypothetical protein [Microbacterium sp.]